MRLYTENLKNKFKNLLNEGDLKGDKKRRQFAEQKVLPFLFELMDEIVSNDDLETLEHELFKDAGAAMAIRRKNNKSYFSVEEGSFYSKWVEHSKTNGLPKIMKDKYLLREIEAVFHEEKHHKQHALMEEKDFLKMSPYSLIYVKEDLILNSDYAWYRENHGKFWVEIEAHMHGYKGSIDFISSVMPNSEFAKQYEEETLKSIPNLVRAEEYLKGENPSSHIISTKFDELVKNTPKDTIQGIIEQYPVFGFVYNEDGTKKNIEDILFMRKEIVKANLNELQKTIEVDNYKTTIASHINKTFATIISSDKQLADEYDKYLAKKQEEKLSDSQFDKQDDNIKFEQRSTPKSTDFFKRERQEDYRKNQELTKEKSFERTF